MCMCVHIWQEFIFLINYFKNSLLCNLYYHKIVVQNYVTILILSDIYKAEKNQFFIKVETLP